MTRVLTLSTAVCLLGAALLSTPASATDFSESADFGDPLSGRFFQRTVFRTDGAKPSRNTLEEQFEIIARRFPLVTLCLYDVRRFSSLDAMRALQGHGDGLRYPVERLLA